MTSDAPTAMKREIRALVEAVRRAAAAAEAGRARAGYRQLRLALREAQAACLSGEPWRRHVVACYRTALANYRARFLRRRHPAMRDRQPLHRIGSARPSRRSRRAACASSRR